MSSHDYPQAEQKFALQEIRNITPQKDRRSTSVKDRLNSTNSKNENLPDLHTTPTTARIGTQNDEKQTKDAILTKIRSQNELLRKQVKDLNSKATGQHASSTAKKGKTKSELEQNFSDNLLRRQLQNAYKQVEHYKKQLQMFTETPDGFDYLERMKRMEDLLADKDDKLEQALTENKVLEKINREQDRELQNYRNTIGYEKKMNTYMEEARCLRERINNMQAINRHNEQSFKKQQEHLVRMTRQYRMVCDKIGISPSTNFTRPEDLEKMLAKRSSQVSRVQEEVSRQEDITQDFEEAYLVKDNASAVKMKSDRSNSFAAIRDGRSLIQRNSSIPNLKEYSQSRKPSEDVEPMSSRLFILNSDKKEIKNKNQENEKSNVTTRINDDSRKSIIRHRSLARINLTKNSDSQHRVSMTYSNVQNEESSFVPSKTDLDIDVEQNKYIPAKVTEDIPTKETKQVSETHEVPLKPLLVVRKSTGGRIESGLSEFNDKEYLPTPLTSKVTKLMVWSDENFVYGIQAFYQGQDTYYVAGEEHLGIEMKRRAKFVNSIEVDPDDQIEWISGKYEEGITYLKVKTVKGIIKEFGTKTGSPNEFKIHVDSNENLTMLHGALYYKKGDENNEDIIILANIGFTLVKETRH